VSNRWAKRKLSSISPLPGPKASKLARSLGRNNIFVRLLPHPIRRSFHGDFLLFILQVISEKKGSGHFKKKRFRWTAGPVVAWKKIVTRSSATRFMSKSS
jgi:hypothetical protein